LPQGLAFTISLYFNSNSPKLPDGVKNDLERSPISGGFEIACQTSQNYSKLFCDPLNDGICISLDLEKAAIPKKPGKIPTGHLASPWHLALG